MENIDELMRQQYQNDDPEGRFPFREEYWEQALALIEADEARRKKRRRFIWFWLCTAFLAAGLGWFIYDRSAGNLASVQNDKYAQEATNTGNSMGSSNQEGSTQLTEAVEHSRGNIQQGTSNREHSTGNVQQGTSNRERSTGNVQQGTFNRERPTGNIQQGTFNRETHFTKNDQSAINTKTNTQTFKHTQSGNLQAAAPGALPAVIQPDAAPTQSAQTAQPTAPFVPTNMTESIDSIHVSKTNSTMPPWLEQLLLLPLPMNPVVFERKIAPVKIKTDTLPKAMASDDNRRLRLGVSLGAAAYPYTPNNDWLGFTGGLFGEWRFHPSWAVSAGVQARLLPGDWVNDGKTSVDSLLLFSFGFEEKRRNETPLGVLLLEAPVSIQQHAGPISFELGMAPGMLLSNLSIVKSYQNSSLGGRINDQTRVEKGDNKPFGDFYFNVFTGVDYRLNSDFSVGLKGVYRFGYVTRQSGIEYNLKPWAELSLKWRF